MKLKVFTQPSCPRCPAAKAVIAQIEGQCQIEQYDMKTEDGLAEALSYDIMSTPSILVFDDTDRVVKEWLGQSPTVDEITKIIK